VALALMDASTLYKRPGTIPLARPALKQQPNPIDWKKTMMRIAIAGTGGFAQLIARTLQEETSHQLVLLSRSVSPQFLKFATFNGLEYR
jgi:hypothetical protein